MLTPDRKIRKLMNEYQKSGKLIIAALRSDVDAKTARKYIRSRKMPSEMSKNCYWKTRKNPFEKHWKEIQELLSNAPELEAKTVFE